jgi:coenzyme F420-reducing hydrogenase beta subunit
MIEITDKSKCDGCNACNVICPVDCITMPMDGEGFYYPTVNEQTCIDCDLCDKICFYVTEREDELIRFETPIVYASYSTNKDVRIDSTSGGIFTELAEKMFDKEGYVGGAIYNPDHSVSHILTDERERLPELRSSKYIESYTDRLFPDTKKRLKEGKDVLVVGAPCQIHALYAYLKKDYQNLVTCDFICLGVNSTKVFQKYLEWLESKYNSKVTKIKFKDKTYGWHRFAIRVDFQNGKTYVKDRYNDPFFVGYLQTHLFLMPACYTCQFKGFPQKSDITLADFWGIEKVDQTMDQDLGTSLVMVNSEKGDAFFKSLGDSVIKKQFKLEDAIQENTAMNKSIDNVDQNLRDAFFRDLDIYPFDKVADKYFPMPTLKRRIKNRIKILLSKV